ncbi:MAG TPA: DUF5946 family protein [Candidatus Dormibacteraeota bacterium]|nr:DUF5946 family protein [Candidatus Dormibacteraeota bacterium]
MCSGCGLRLPASGQPPDRRQNASAECWAVYGEVLGFELNHLVPLGQYHQLMVDTYGAQHAGDDARSIRVAYSLVGLFLALERGRDGLQVRHAHQRMGKPDPSWPAFDRPSDVGATTVLDVAEAGVRADSVAGHADAVGRWAQSVWRAWSAQHRAAAALAERLLGDAGPMR